MDESKFDYLPGLIQRTRLAHIAVEKRLLRIDLFGKACDGVLRMLDSRPFPGDVVFQ